MPIDPDGKYITLDELKAYALGTIADPNNPSVYNNSVQGTPDDAVLTQCINRAEMEFDRIAGIAFDQQTVTDVQAFLPFVDGNSWLVLFARERAPITSVTSITLRDMRGTNQWNAQSWASDDIVLPINDGYAHPDCAKVMIYPANSRVPTPTGQLLVKWTYVGGFATIPQSLKAVICRLSWWIYKLREVPINQIAMPNLGIMQIPLRIPPDINADILLWQPGFN